MSWVPVAREVRWDPGVVVGLKDPERIGARAWTAPGALPGGRAKVDLQNQFIGAACNIKRWLRWLARQIKGKAPDNSLKRLHV